MRVSKAELLREREVLFRTSSVEQKKGELGLLLCELYLSWERS